MLSVLLDWVRGKRSMLLLFVLAITFCLVAAILLWGRPLLLLYASEPVGGGIPAVTALLILVTPQMADMMAAISGGRGLGGRYDEAQWHQSGFGLATAFLGFQGWFWMRAALNARVNMRDTRWPDEKSWPERWAPRLVLLPALLIALSPLVVAAEGRITWQSVPLVGVLVAMVSTGLLFLFIWGRASIIPLPQRSARPLPRLRCARLIAAAPLHRMIAIASLVVGVVGFVAPLARPDDVNDALHTAAAALLAMGCLIPLAAFLLAVLRDLIDVPLKRLRLVHPPGQALVTPASDVMGVLLLLLVPVLGGWACEQAGFYDVAKAAPLPPRPTIAAATTAFAGCGDPVIAVIEGGASRSAAWGLSMMAALDAATGDRFSHQLFAISSVSGGSLAAATYALVRGRADRAGVPVWNGAQAGMVELARADLLSSSVFRMLTTDALSGVPTRGWSLARAFEHVWSWDQGFDIPGIQHGEPHFLDVRADKPCSPYLLLNGTDSTTGSRVITASLDIAESGVFSDSVDALAASAGDVSLADAVLGSARFPIISPPGNLVMADRAVPALSVVDGGVFEAVGARTAHELALALIHAGRRPIVVVIRNDGDEAPDAPPPCQPESGNPKDAARIAAAAGKARGVYVPEFLTSLLGLNAARGAHGRAELAALRTSLCPTGDFYDFDLPALDGDVGNPGVPMNWVLDGQNCTLLLGAARMAPRTIQQVAALAQRLGAAPAGGDLVARTVELIANRHDAELCHRATGQGDKP